MEDMGDAQKNILRIIATSKPTLVNQLAATLGKDHAGVFRSVESLEQKRLTYSMQESVRAKRFLFLTDKGACYACLKCQVSLEEIRPNYGKTLAVVRIVDELKSFIRRPALLSQAATLLLELLVRYDLFDSDGWVYEEIRSERGSRPHHLLLALKLELVYQLLEKGPGEGIGNYERKGIFAFLRDIHTKLEQSYQGILKDAEVMASDE